MKISSGFPRPRTEIPKYVDGLFKVLSKKWEELDCNDDKWMKWLKKVGIDLYIMDANDGISMWWDFVQIINESEVPVVACKCPTGEWTNEDDPSMPLLVVPKELAEKMLIMGFAPDA